jgi:hypothetical protein
VFAGVRRVRVRDEFDIGLRVLTSDPVDHRQGVESEADMSWRNPPARDRAVQILFKYRAQVFRRHRSQHPSRLRSRNGFRRAGTRYHSLGAGGRRRTLELLRHAGLPRDPAAELSGYLVSSLVGMVIVERRHHHGSDIEKRDDAIRVRMPSHIALPPRKYANVVDTRSIFGRLRGP